MTREFFLKESMIMLSVVIPTFNESKNIRNLVAQIDVALKGVDYEIVFVDDSKDNTPDVIMEVAKEYPQVRMEHRKNGTGLATAVLDGFKLAKGEYMVWMLIYSTRQSFLNICIRLWKVVQTSVYLADLFQAEMMADLTGTESSYLEQQER